MMGEQESIGPIGVVHRTRFDKDTGKWHAEASLDSMYQVVTQLERAQAERDALVEAARWVVKQGNVVLQRLREDEPLGLSVLSLQTKIETLAALLPSERSDEGDGT